MPKEENIYLPKEIQKILADWSKFKSPNYLAYPRYLDRKARQFYLVQSYMNAYDYLLPRYTFPMYKFEPVNVRQIRRIKSSGVKSTSRKLESWYTNPQIPMQHAWSYCQENKRKKDFGVVISKIISRNRVTVDFRYIRMLGVERDYTIRLFGSLKIVQWFSRRRTRRYNVLDREDLDWNVITTPINIRYKLQDIEFIYCCNDDDKIMLYNMLKKNKYEVNLSQQHNALSLLHRKMCAEYHEGLVSPKSFPNSTFNKQPQYKQRYN